ncbi:MAG: FtsX-like permease family protein [Thermomicrobiales bacterium]
MSGSITTTYALRSLRLNRKRTAVTILGVILSAALLCGVLLLGASFQRLMIEHEVFMGGDWHARFHAVPAANAPAITGSGAVQTAMLSQPLGSATYGSHNTARPYLYVTAYDAASWEHMPIRLIAGRLPERPGELLVSGVMTRDSGLDLQPGATLRLTFGQREFPEYASVVKGWGGEEFVALQDAETFTPAISSDYTVVGVIAPLADETSMPAAFPALAFLDPAQLAATDSVDITVLARNPRSIGDWAPGLADAAGLAATPASDGAARQGVTYNERLLPWLGGSGRSNYVQFFLMTIATLIVLIVGGAALLIANAFAISVRERTRQFGILASVGATPAQIRRMVLTEAGVIAAVGIPLGILCAIAGAGALVMLTRGLIAGLIADAEGGLPLVISPLALALTAIFAAATILLSAWAPARRAARISPIDAIRQSGDVPPGAVGAARLGPLVRRVFGFEGELALKSLRRDRRKHRATLLSLMLSIVLFVAFNSLMLYTDKTQSMASAAMNWDLQIDLDYRQSHADGFAEGVAALPEVQQVAYIRCAHAEYVPPAGVLTGPAQRALQELNDPEFENIPRADDAGAYHFVLKVCAVGPSEFAHYAAQLGLEAGPFADPAAPQGILLNHMALRQGGKLYDLDLFTLQPGDTLTASRMEGWAAPSDSGAGVDRMDWTVGAVATETPLGFMGVSLVPELIVSDEVFDALSPRMEQLGPIAQGHMVVQSDDPQAAVAAIGRLYKATAGGDISYYAMDDFNRSGELRRTLTTLFFAGFLTLITLIGVANIINTLDTSIKLRRREIAMLRAVGMTPGGVQRMLRYESLFTGVQALLLGLPIGIAVSVFLYLRFDGVSAFAFTLPWGAILLCIAGTLALVLATMMIAGAMIRDDAIVETIKAENL